jgi:uncharacterized protein
MKTIEETDKLTHSERQLLAELKKVVLKVAPSAVLLLYGSTARGERGPESDYDVLAIVETPLPAGELDAISNSVYELELAYGIVISVAIYTLEQWNSPIMRVSPYHRSVEKEAVLI